MTLKYTNKEHTAATFNGTSFSLVVPGAFELIGDVPTRDAVKAWLAAGNAPEPYPAPSVAELIKHNEAAIDGELDRRAQAMGYRDIVAACSYASGDPSHRFTIEGRAFVKLRQDTWDVAYAVLADVDGGKRAMPTPEEAVAMMPALVLP